MNNYIDTNNKIWGFDDTQTNLIPEGAVEIPSTFTMDQIPYITLINGVPTFNQEKYDSDKAAIQASISAKASALAKLAALGLTQDEINALL